MEPNEHREIEDCYRQMAPNAARLLARWRGPSRVPETMSLVHRAFLRLMLCQNHATSPEQVAGVWCKAMRSVLVDMARRRATVKRGGADRTLNVGAEPAAAPSQAELIIDVHEALNRLESIHPEDARVVEMRFFGGCSWNEIGSSLHRDPIEVRNRWRTIKGRLRRELDA